MNYTILAFVIAIVAAVVAAATNLNNDNTWIILVAGSNGYYNYRHQSDVCHAFQLFKKNGIPESNIITMMYDDIANSTQNPVRGKIFNVIGGDDVYEGVPKDYVGSDVTAKNFLKILSGQSMNGIGSGKTVKAGPDTKIFVFYSDHGAPGLIAMPSGGYLYAKDLNETVERMYEQKLYKEMIFYIEACESGSMFDRILRNDRNVYGFTASNPHVSSYACDYDNKVRAYLNDCWSRNWIMDTINNDVGSRTFLQQYTTVKAQTTESPACAYGDLSIQSNVLATYFSGKNAGRPIYPTISGTSVSSRNVYEDHLKRRLALASNSAEALDIQAELNAYYAGAKRADIVYGAFAHALNVNTKLFNDDRCHSSTTLNHDCIKEATIAHNNVCGEFTEYSFKYAKYIASACNNNSAVDIAQEFNNICSVVRI